MKNNILLVDDEETLRYVLSETLTEEGYNVDVANNGIQALEHFKRKPYDLLITDINMHGMNGLQLIREIKRTNANLKIAIITAYGSLEMVKEATRLGVMEFISKPFKIQEIKDVTTKLLSDQNTSKEDDVNDGDCQSNAGPLEQITDNFMVPTGLTYNFDGPASQPKSTVIFDSVAINQDQVVLIFGNTSGQNGKHREWWENNQIAVMIKTLFRSTPLNTPKNILNTINNFLCKTIQSHIDMSMLCALIDKNKQTIKYVNAGNSIVCSIFSREGRMETMDSFLYLLGVSTEIEISERTISFSHGSRLAISSSNKISEIMEEGALINETVENILQSIKNPHGKEFTEVDLNTKLNNNRNERNLDDETVLLINLESNTSLSTRTN